MKKLILHIIIFTVMILGVCFGLYKLSGLGSNSIETTVISTSIPETSEDAEENTASGHVSATSSDVHFTNKNRKSGELESLMYDIAEKTKD